MSAKTYEDYVNESAETRRDLDEVLNPIFGHLKKAFEIVIGPSGFSKSDFKKLSDARYYQGGYPSVNSPPKEAALALMVSNLLKLEKLQGKETLKKILENYGVSAEVISPLDEGSFILAKEDQEDLEKSWAGAGIDKEIPETRQEFLQALVEKSQVIQKEICEQADSIKVDAAEEVEEKFKIKKGNFVKAVSLAAVKLKKGEGAMAEKVDSVHDQIDNLEQSIAFLTPRV